MIVQPGEGNVIVPFIARTTAGARITDLAFNTAGLQARWMRHGDGAWTALPLVSGSMGVWSSGGFFNGGNGIYFIGMANTAFTSFYGQNVLGAVSYYAILQVFGAANMEPVEIRFD